MRRIKKGRREERITLRREMANQYSLFGSHGRGIAGCDADYSFYFKNINLKDNGDIEGRYLGTDYQILLDDHCKEVYYDNNDSCWYYADSRKKVDKIRLAVFENKKGIIVVIGN